MLILWSHLFTPLSLNCFQFNWIAMMMLMMMIAIVMRTVIVMVMMTMTMIMLITPARSDHPFHSLGGGLLASHCTLLVSHYTLHTCGVTLHTPHNIFRIIQGYYAALLNVVNRVGSTQIIIKSTFDTDVQRYLEHSRCVLFY